MKKSTSNIILFFLVSSISSLRTYSWTSFKRHDPCKRFVLYYNDILLNGTDVANATSTKAINSTELGEHKLEMVVIFDYPMTKHPSLVSTQVSRALVFFFYDMKCACNAWFAYVLVFNSSVCKGTLSIMGADLMDDESQDLSVVGGTVYFFMAKGISTFRTDEVEDVAYFSVRMDIWSYE